MSNPPFRHLHPLHRPGAGDSKPRPSVEDRAREAAAARAPELRPWRPEAADLDHASPIPEHVAVGGDALVMDIDPEPPEAQTLWRAATRNAIAGRLFDPDRRLEGQTWYDRLPRLTGVRTEAVLDGRSHALDAYPLPAPRGNLFGPLPWHPEAIRMRLAIAPASGPGHVLALDTDLAFIGEVGCWVGDVLPLVTAGSTLPPRDLAEVLRYAFFAPSDDWAADSWARQLADFDREALHLAIRRLCSEDGALRVTLAAIVERELFGFLPRERAVDIAVRARPATVTLGPAGLDATARGPS